MDRNLKTRLKMTNVSVTRKFKIQRKWTSDEVKQVLDRLKATVAMGQVLEKPTAEVYYNKMLSELQFVCCNVSQIKNKVRNLRKCYTETVQWRDSIGQGMLEKSGPDALRAVVLSKCPDFDDLDEIFGNTVQVSPLCVISSVSTYNPEDNEQFQKKNFIFGKDELVSDGEDEISHLSDSCYRPHMSDENKMKNDYKTVKGLENHKMEMEIAKFNFEKEKWQNELELRHRQLDLEEKKLEFEMANAKYEIEMKYSTQLEMAKLNCKS